VVTQRLSINRAVELSVSDESQLDTVGDEQSETRAKSVQLRPETRTPPGIELCVRRSRHATQ